MTGDLISREALKKAIEELEITEELVDYDCDDVSTTGVSQYLDRPDVLDLIDNAPTVDPYDICKGVITGNYALGFHLGWEKAKERPQGEWIEKVERRGCFAGDKTVYSYTCPFCKVTEFKKYPFCHCGADMRGGLKNDRE